MAAVGSWWSLVPDQSHAVVTAGYGTFTTGDSDPRTNTYCFDGTYLRQQSIADLLS